MFLTLTAFTVQAGDLDDFEKGLRSPSPSNPDGPSDRGGNGSSGGYGGENGDCVQKFSDILPCMVLNMLFAVVKGATEETIDYAVNERQDGSPVVPVARLENTYQSLIGTDIDGYTLRGELGFGPVAVAGGWTRYWEERPDDRLDSWVVEGLWRFGSNEHFRLDLAFGGRGFERVYSTKGFQTGLSTGIYPWDCVGFEGDARWAFFESGELTDLRGVLRLTHPEFPYAGARAGYRYITIGNQNLHGPEIGLVVTW